MAVLCSAGDRGAIGDTLLGSFGEGCLGGVAPDEGFAVGLGRWIVFDPGAVRFEHFGVPTFVVVHGHAAEGRAEVVAREGGGVEVEDVHGRFRFALGGWMEIEKIVLCGGGGKSLHELMVIFLGEILSAVFQEPADILGVFGKALFALGDGVDLHGDEVREAADAFGDHGD